MNRDQLGTIFTLTINTENDAFQPHPGPELAARLRTIADALEGADTYDMLANGGWLGHFQTIFDSNGNDVGRWAIKTPAQLGF